MSGGLKSITESHSSHPNECRLHLSSREHVAQVADQVAKARRAADLFERIMESTNVVRRTIMSFLDTKDYLAMMGTTKAIRQPLFAERFDVNSRLGYFVKDPIALRQIWCDCNALIAGDLVMQILEGDFVKCSPLQIFVESGERFDKLHKHVVLEGYKVTSRLTSVKSLGRRFKQTTYHSKTKHGIVKGIQIMTSRDELPVQTILQNCSISSCFNIMSWNKIYSVFAHITFARKMAYKFHCQAYDGVFDHTHGSWRDLDMMNRGRGSFPRMRWEEPGSIIGNCGKPGDHDFLVSKLLLGFRRIGDQASLTVALNTDGIQVTNTTAPDTLLEMSQFEVRGGSDMERSWLYAGMEVFEHPLLEHRYLLPCYESYDEPGDFAMKLKRSLDNQGYDEVRARIPGRDWKPFAGTSSPHNHIHDSNWDDSVSDNPEVQHNAKDWTHRQWDILKASEHWHYYDCHVPIIYARYQEKNNQERDHYIRDYIGDLCPSRDLAYRNWAGLPKEDV